MSTCYTPLENFITDVMVDYVDDTSIPLGDTIKAYINEKSSDKPGLFNDIPDADLHKSEIIDIMRKIAFYWAPNDPTVESVFNASNLNIAIDDVNAQSANRQVDRSTFDSLIDSLAAVSRRSANRSFLHDAYGTATNVKEAAEKEVLKELVECFFINSKGPVTNSVDMNRNILDYQQRLLNKIIDYFVNSNNLDENTKVALSKRLLYENGRTTEILDIVRPIGDRFFKNLTPDFLTQLYIKSKSSPNAKERENAKRNLDAYNAYVFLKHLDSYIHDVFKKSISINNRLFNVLTLDDTKYSLAEKMSSVHSTFRDSDPDVEKEVNEVVKKIIETRPLHNFGEDEVIPGQYLRFQDFELAIAAIKDLALTQEANNINFTAEWLELHPNFRDSLSMEALNYIFRCGSLANAINLIGENPRVNFSHVFEVLTNPYFIEDFERSLYNKRMFPDPKLKNVFYSVGVEIFNKLKSNSNSDSNFDYFAYITNVCNTMFSNHMLLIYVDEKGNIAFRQLRYNETLKFKKKLLSKVDIANSLIDWKLTEKELNFIPKVIGGTVQSCTFNIPGTNYLATVNYKELNVFISRNGEKVKSLSSLLQNDKFMEWIQEVTLVNVSDPELLNILKYRHDNSELNIVEGLLNMAARITANSYVNQQLKGLGYNDVTKKIDSIFKKSNQIKYNVSLKSINLLPKIDLEFLNSIAFAQAITEGIGSSPTVKDSKAHSQSIISLSRLSGNIAYQWAKLERRPDSATRDFILFRPGFFNGVFNNIEYANNDGSQKDSTDLTAGERTYAGFMYGFLPALINSEKDGYNIVNAGNALFLMSVNSDKNYINYGSFDLNTLIDEYKDANGLPKRLIDLNLTELRDLINKQLGKYYANMINQIDTDFDTLATFIKANGYNDFPGFDYIDNFTKLNSWYYQSGIEKGTVVEFIKQLCYEYNRKHRKHPIALIDNIHFSKKSTDVEVLPGKFEKREALVNNATIISLIAKFRPEGCKYSSAFDGSQAERFWKRLAIETVRSLVNSEIEFDLRPRVSDNAILKKDSSGQLKINEGLKIDAGLWFRHYYPSWVSPSDRIIYAKVTIDGVTYSIATKTDLVLMERAVGMKFFGTDEETISNRLLKEGNIEINPVLDQYNNLDYLITLEWLNAGVGTFATHSGKAGKSSMKTSEMTDLSNYDLSLQAESSKFLGQHKRNVSWSALMHAFQVNKLNGIRGQYNIAAIDDFTDIVHVISGRNNEVVPYNGVTFVDPFTALLENYSLDGNFAGSVKKPFCHFKNPQTGTGGIIKTASFTFTNNTMRNSIFDANLMKKMTDHSWIDEDGNLLDIDIVGNSGKGIGSYNGQIIEYGDIYFKRNGVIYKVEPNTITKLDTRTKKDGTLSQCYSRIITPVNSLGNVIGTSKQEIVEVNSNYDLWNFFGGYYSMEMQRGQLVESEISVKQTVQAMNSIGQIKLGHTLTTESTQEDIYLPLKHVGINYLVTHEAIKQGAANLNHVNKFFTTDNDLDFYTIELTQIGILLDKEHHADNAEVSLMTLVISAAAGLGYTYERADGLYQMLSQVSRLGAKLFVETYRKHLSNPEDENATKNFQERILKIIIKNLAKPDSSNFSESLALDIKLDIANNGGLFSDLAFPISDNTLYNKAISSLASYISRSTIKLKFNGSLSVLNPSGQRMKVVEIEDIDGKQSTVKYNSFDRSMPDFTTEDIDLLQCSISFENPLQRDEEKSVILTFNDGVEIAVSKTKTPENYAVHYLSGVINDTNVNTILELIINVIPEKAKVTLFGRFPNENPDVQLLQKLADNLRFSKFGEKDASLLDPLVLPILRKNPTGNQVGKLTFNEQLEIQQRRKDHNPLYEQGENGKQFGSLVKLEMGRKYKVQFNKEALDRELNLIDERLNSDISEYEKKYYKKRKELLLSLDGNYERIYNLDPETYYYFLSLTNRGVISRVSEYIKDGRDLGTYNVRFMDSSHKMHQMWELVSIKMAHELEEIRGDKNQDELFALWLAKYDLKYESFAEAYKKTRNQLLKDLETLSNSVETKLDLFEKHLSAYDQALDYLGLIIDTGSDEEIIEAKKAIEKAEGRLNLWIARSLSLEERTELDTLFPNIPVNFNDRMNYVRNSHSLKNTVNLIGNGEVEVNKGTINVQAYELIMPKVFATTYGLNDQTDLSAIIKDRGYFIRQAIHNRSALISPQKYDIMLRRYNGKHIYITTEEHKDPNLRLVPETLLETEEHDGRIIRIDPDTDKDMYDILPNSEIYRDSLGNEVIVVSGDALLQTISDYINNIAFDEFVLSQNLRNESIFTNALLETLLDNETVGGFIKYTLLKNDTSTTPEDRTKFILDKYKQWDSITEDNYMNKLSPNHPLIKNGLAKHSSFLKSLEVIAARIPAQSMQSFMGMKVVAFEDTDTNNAYVSNLLIFLQGSDFDIDSVTLWAYNIPHNGVLPIWTPYSNYETITTLNKSMEMPVPTGKEATMENTKNISKIMLFIDSYKSLIGINKKNKPFFLPNKELATYDVLKRFLKETAIPSPDESIELEVERKFQEIFPNVNYQDILEVFRKALDKHNLYLDTTSEKNPNKFRAIADNYMLYETFMISSDPVNLTQGLVSVDTVTAPLKEKSKLSDASENSKYRMAGIASNKSDSIEETLEGKDCIAKSASSIKGFFTLFHYFNKVLNGDFESDNLSLAQSRLIGRGFSKKNPDAIMLANVRALDPSTIENEEVWQKVQSMNSLDDVVLVLSALLGLSADNAKELVLSKLNAGIDMIGLYLYGTAIGKSFDELSELMMSPTALILKKQISGNVFNNNPGYGQVDRAFTYFTKKGFFELLDLVDISRQEANLVYRYLFGICKGHIEYDNEMREEYDDVENGKELLENKNDEDIATLKSDGPLWYFMQNYGLNRILRDLEYMKTVDKWKYQFKNNSRIIRYIEQLEKYAINYKSINWKQYKQLKSLAYGAKNMAKIGLIAGLNKGIPSNDRDLFKYIAIVEEALLEEFDLYKEYAMSATDNDIQKIDLQRWITDPEYREQTISDYEKYKHSFNLLDVIDKDPKLFGYVSRLAETDEAFKQTSFKYRSTRKVYYDLHKQYKVPINDVVSGLYDYLSETTINDWLYSLNITITIPSGMKIYEPNGKLSENPLTKAKEIRLGTSWANATFLKYMDTIVFPAIHRGDIEEGRVSSIRDTLFASKLSADLRTNTTLGNPMIIRTVPINMLSRSENGLQAMLDYIRDFDLNIAKYTYMKDGNNVAVSDLILYYTMIAHGWKQRENSMVNLFTNQKKSGVLKNFLEFETGLDRSNYILGNTSDYLSEIKPYIAKHKSPFGAKEPFIISLHNGEYKLMEKQERNDLGEFENTGGEMVGNYEVMDKGLDKSVFASGQILNQGRIYSEEFETEDNDGNKTKHKLEITFHSGSDSVKLDNVDYPEIKIRMIIKNGVPIPDAETIKGQIMEKKKPTDNCQ